MSKSEKRYFKLYATQHTNEEENNYIKLFNLIENQKNYDEKKLKHPANGFKQFHLLKLRLYEIILKRLHVYRSSADSTEKSLEHYKNHAIILFEKGLYDSCYKMLRKGKHLATEHEKHGHLIEFIRIESELISAMSFKNINEDHLTALYQSMFNVLDKYKIAFEYGLLNSRILLRVNKQGITRTKEDKVAFDKIIKSPKLRSTKKANSFLALYYFYACYSTYYFIRNNYSNAFIYTQKIVDLIESKQAYKKDFQKQYLASLSNLVSCQTALQHYHDIPPLIQKIKSIEIKHAWLRNDIYYNACSTELKIYFKLGKFEEGYVLVKELENKLYGDEDVILNKVYQFTLYYNMACILFGVKNYTAANNYLNKIINANDRDSRSDVYCFARIIQLIVQIELEHLSLVEYMVKSTYRFLHKRKKLYKFETLILGFIKKKLPAIKNRADLILAYKDLKTEISNVIMRPSEKNVSDYFDFVSWLESKIENRPFADIVQEKVRLRDSNSMNKPADK